MADEAHLQATFASWYTPDKARELAAESLATKDIVRAGESVLERVKGGLIAAGAATASVVRGGEAAEISKTPVAVNQKLWPAYDPDTSNFWQGDLVFAYRIPKTSANRRFRINVVTRYFGVRLNPSDFDAQFPPRSPATKAEPADEPPARPGAAIASPTADEFATWYTPQEVSDIAAEYFKSERGLQLYKAILKRIKDGLLQVAAAKVFIKRGDGTEEFVDHPILISKQLWSDYNEPASDFWRGDIEFAIRARSIPGIFAMLAGSQRYYDCRFSRADVDRHLRRAMPTAPDAVAPSAVEPVSPAIPASNRGRPRAEFWDDLLVEMFRRIHFGDLKPKRQAEIERAMLDWASIKGIPVNESSVRPRAAKIWKALKEEG